MHPITGQHLTVTRFLTFLSQSYTRCRRYKLLWPAAAQLHILSTCPLKVQLGLPQGFQARIKDVLGWQKARSAVLTLQTAHVYGCTAKCGGMHGRYTSDLCRDRWPGHITTGRVTTCIRLCLAL